MRINYFGYAFYIFLVFLVTGCAGKSNTDENESPESGDLIDIGLKQFEADNMKIGKTEIRLFEEIVACNGHVEAAPNGMARISIQISGIIETINCSPGDYVKRGQVLCKVSSVELIELQQDFAETSANLKRLEADWQRSTALFEEKIGSEKDYMAIEAEYKVARARKQSLKLRLELLNLDIARIEAGELLSVYPVLAPITGYITAHNIVIGQFIEQQEKLLEIVDNTKLHLQLEVFENEIGKIKAGQQVFFKSMGESGATHRATLTAIGKRINPDTKTIECIAEINAEQGISIINHAYVEAEITVDQKEARALPSEAIIKKGEDYYVFVLESTNNQQYSFRRTMVITGRQYNGYTEIIEGVNPEKVLVRGAYNLKKE